MALFEVAHCAAFYRALEDTVLPLSKPIQGVDGQTISEILVPKGTDIYLGFRACNTNRALWGDDALEWKPERWLSPLPDSVSEAKVPGIYSNLCVSSWQVLLCPADLLTGLTYRMTFLGGGRACM